MSELKSLHRLLLSMSRLSKIWLIKMAYLLCYGAENIADLGDGTVNISISRSDVVARRWGDQAMNIGIIAQ